jgi:ArsR family metal-binding transcriptional regulator
MPTLQLLGNGVARRAKGNVQPTVEHIALPSGSCPTCGDTASVAVRLKYVSRDILCDRLSGLLLTSRTRPSSGSGYDSHSDLPDLDNP